MSPDDIFTTVLPLGVASHGQRVAPLSKATARWIEVGRKVALEVVDRHPPRGIVRYEGEVWVTRWHTRVIATWVAGILRCNAAELIALADAQPRPQGG